MKLINSNYLRLTIVTGNKQNDDESKNDDGNSWSFVNKNETKSDTKPNDEAPKNSLNMIQIIYLVFILKFLNLINHIKKTFILEYHA